MVFFFDEQRVLFVRALFISGIAGFLFLLAMLHYEDVVFRYAFEEPLFLYADNHYGIVKVHDTYGIFRFALDVLHNDSGEVNFRSLSVVFEPQRSEVSDRRTQRCHLRVFSVYFVFSVVQKISNKEQGMKNKELGFLTLNIEY